MCILEDQAANDKLETNHLEDLEEAFNKLGDLLGVKEIEKIAEIFKSKEGQINRAFEYINVQDSDCSKIKEEIDQLEEQKFQTLDALKDSANRFREQILRLDVSCVYMNLLLIFISKNNMQA